METKLDTITTQYHSYKKDQVLTHTQLNESIDYFEDQIRLSRISLSGVGIVCGFNLRFNPAENSITITQGTGVTTDGDLVKLRKDIPDSALKNIDIPEIKYTAFKTFIDDKAFYKPFFYKGEEQIELWELIPEDKVTDESALSELPDTENMVVLLYLESYPKDPDLCSGIDCDNQGTEHISRLRVLLVTKDDADHIIAQDGIYQKYHLKAIYDNLKDIALKRVILNNANTNTLKTLQASYRNAIFNNNIIEHLKKGFEAILSHFNLNTDNAIIQNRINNWFGFSILNTPVQFQYRYDLLKDLVDTYTELKELFIRLTTECCPDIGAFPKHLMLGKVTDTEAHMSYRHRFYKSPVHNDRDYGKKFMSLVDRTKNILNLFSVPPGEVEITPSLIKGMLGHKAIPFYYKVDEELLKSWNYYKTSIYKQKNNLSYHTAGLENIPQVQQPLQYGPDTYDFYRIEGHQGKNYADTLEQIEAIRTTNSLAFDVKAISIGLNEQEIEMDDYECEFEDLQVLLKAWIAEQECILAEVAAFFSGFSIAEPGTNVKTPVRELAASSDFTLSMRADATKVPETKEYVVITERKVVEDNLTLDENALGNIVKTAFDKNKTGSVNDIIADAGLIANDTLDPEVWGGKAEIKKLVIDDSIKILAYTHVLSGKMPGGLKGVSNDIIASYNITLEQLCSFVKQLQSTYQNVELSQNLRAFYGLLINQLASICCSGKKLQLLLKEIEDRKERILLHLQLSGFAEKHPGLEHHAGVRKGGTFVLVYLAKTERVTPGRDMALKDPFIRANIREPEVSRELLALETRIGNAGLKGITSIPGGTVIADFSLPYLCCSDCSPVNFIVPKPVVFLRLEKDTFCLGTDESPLLFEVSPEDGIIKPDTEIEGLTVEGNQLIIDNESFPEEMLGSEIRFTVNDQVTYVTLTVYRTPVFDFKVPESPATEPGITFLPEGDGLDKAMFRWDFGDGNTSEERNPTHTYKLPVNEENKVTVSLTVTPGNGACPDTVEHTIAFETVSNEGCIEETEALIREELERISQLMDVDEDIRKNIIDPTVKIYETVLEDLRYLDGDLNGDLEKMFTELVRTTAQYLLKWQDSPIVFQQLSTMFIAQVKLLYLILHCQPLPVLEKYQEILTGLLDSVTEILQTLFKRQIFFDKDNELKNFLEEYLFEIQADFIKDYINKQLEAIL
ncbi:PKD domain-containing protein [Sinomicrobium sp. M5D2P17]